MERKITEPRTRQELADYLEELAAQLRRGNLLFGSEMLQAPEDFEVKMTLKEKKHHAACKLEWRWTSSEDRKKHETPAESALKPTHFKQIKKELARSFRALKQAVNGDMTPDAALLSQFDSLSRAFVAQAQPEWERAAREYLGHMENLFRSIREGRKEAVLHEIQDLQNRMVACHKEYA
jgi:XXXCH domain-containing protein